MCKAWGIEGIFLNENFDENEYKTKKSKYGEK